MLTIILFIFLFLLITVIHEFGHLLAAKAFGVYCKEFSVGMGPLLFSKQIGETKYSFRALLLGGFVSMAGENDGSEIEEEEIDLPPERTLAGLPPLKRAIVMMAGICMNFLLALFIVVGILLHSGAYAQSPDTTVLISKEEYPAYKAGIREGDRITCLRMEDGSYLKTDSFVELSTFIDTYKQGSITVTVDRNGEKLEFEVEPLYLQEEERFVLGITSGGYNVVEINFFNAWYYALDYMFMTTKLILNAILQLFMGVGLDNLSGPVGIYSATKEAVDAGSSTYFNLIAMLSLNIGIANAIPLPILDGGRVLLLIIEAIIRRPIPKKAQEIAMRISVMILLFLFIFATSRDILRLFN